ncbi:MAG: TRAP transporter large permease [Planctomycetota bacterium]|jgi:C4-dicarboxylate transporter DctM subunit|nr:TRAP transporter large permease [Planctomycetota bacterium]
MTTLSICLFSFIILLVIGMPVFASLAISGAISLIFNDFLPLAVITTSLFEGMNIFPLLAIPCFLVAGSLMEKGEITEQIVNVVKIMVGRTYGGMGITTVLACTLFAAISGSGTSTVAAVGTLLIPAMIRNGYSATYAGAAAATGGTIGILIPPSNPMILYAIIGNLSVTGMFTAGFVPGAILSVALCLTAWLLARKDNFRADDSTPPFSFGRLFRAVYHGFFSLATIVVVLGSIYTGLATPVEASVVAVLWALFVGFLINRALTPRKVVEALNAGAFMCGSLVIIMGAATLFGRILTYEEAPIRLANAVLEYSQNKYVVLLLIIAALYVLGMFMETLVTVILVAPVLLPMIIKLGVDPIHFGIIMIMCNEVGLLTPPLGVNIFVASKISNASVEKLAIASLPYIGTMTLVILLITFVPWFSTVLPKLLGFN